MIPFTEYFKNLDSQTKRYMNEIARVRDVTLSLVALETYSGLKAVALGRDEFYEVVYKNGQLLLWTHGDARKVGKTSLLSDVSLNLMTMGYKVGALSTHPFNDFPADYIITSIDISGPRLGDHIPYKYTGKNVIIVDEYDYVKLAELRKLCKIRQIPLIGFV